MREAKRKEDANRGITLISLVITIILLLILAAVAISLAVDSDGLFGKAGQAANKWNSSVATEGAELENLAQMANSVGGTTPPPSTLPDGWNPNAVVDTVEEGDRIAPIPNGFVASKVSTEDQISEGLVIYQTNTDVDDTNHPTALTTYNQYVWIPVDDINDMVMCSVCGGGVDNLVYNDTTKTLTCTSTHAEGTTPALVGKLYTVDYDYTDKKGIHTYEQNFEGNNQTYNANSGNREPAVITGNSEGTGTKYDGATDNYHGLETASAFLEQLQGDFDNMAKSVAKYGGFYISRYEIGTNGTSKKGQTVLNEAETTNWYTMHDLLRMNGTNIATQMIWGSQYDQMIKFLEEDTTNEPYIGHTDRNISSEPAVSGNNLLDEMSNIFDLEGNYYERTAEAYGSGARVYRGRLLPPCREWQFRSSLLSHPL